MEPRSRTAFLALILVQAAHSTEEYAFALYDVFAPARFAPVPRTHHLVALRLGPVEDARLHSHGFARLDRARRDERGFENEGRDDVFEAEVRHAHDEVERGAVDVFGLVQDLALEL